MNESTNPAPIEPESKPKNNSLGRILAWLIIGIITITLAIAAWYGWVYTQTPANLRAPTSAHYHFRLQIINDGQPVHFADNAFQTPYDKLSCSVALPEEPIHFHDNLDQFVHIHWQGMTGGMLLKQYGWNEIGGSNSVLGYRFDQGWWPKPINTHGNLLPQRTAQTNYYLYTGNQTGHQLRIWADFLDQDLEVFFNNITSTTLIDLLPTSIGNQDPELMTLHHVLGNIVLFVQKDQPIEEQVQKYFNQLIPVPESTCGG